MKHKKREPQCKKCGSSLVWPGRKICQRCLMLMAGIKPKDWKPPIKVTRDKENETEEPK